MPRANKREQKDSDEEERRIGKEDKEKLVLKEIQSSASPRFYFIFFAAIVSVDWSRARVYALSYHTGHTYQI